MLVNVSLLSRSDFISVCSLPQLGIKTRELAGVATTILMEHDVYNLPNMSLDDADSMPYSSESES